MATVVTADIHLSANPRDAYRIRWCEKSLPAILERERADRLLILGDVTSEKDYHGAWLTNKVVSIVRTMAEICPVYILEGNHDWLLNPANPFFEFLGRYKRVRWIKDIKYLSLVGLGDRCLFIPHQRKLEAWQSMPQLKEEWDWVFTHATFKGAKNEQDMELDGPSPGLMLGHRVVSGDVHVPQKDGPITYVGPPFRINFGDTYQPRILLLDQYGMNQRLCEGPRKVLLEVSDWGMLEGAWDDGLCRKGDMVKIRYEVAPQDFDKWPSVRRRIEEWAQGHRIELDSALPIPLMEEEAAPRRRSAAAEVSTASDDEAVVKAYCDRHRVGEQTLRLGLRLMEKAK